MFLTVLKQNILFNPIIFELFISSWADVNNVTLLLSFVRSLLTTKKKPSFFSFSAFLIHFTKI